MKTRLLLHATILLAGLLLLTSCSGKKDRMGTVTDKIENDSIIRIMPLGNSITYGNYHPEPRPEGMITGYRQSLWLRLMEAGYNVDFVGSRTTGADAIPEFDPHNEGYPGWTDDQIKENVYKWLKKNPPHIIMLHIGTNGLDPDPDDVEGILDEIDRYENDYDHHIKVIMAKIINRSTYSQLTTQFNQNIEKMAIDRVVREGDDIVVIDMEFETGIDYRLNTSGGEMFDNLHPFVGGHEKMAVRWFKALQEVLPGADRTANIIDPALSDMDFDPGTRVKDGLIALYRFTEGDGNLIQDVSGVGVPLDLFINDETNIIWDPVQGLEVSRDAILIPSEMNMKVVRACMATNAISVETWIRTGNIEQEGPAHIVCISDPMEKGITLSQEFKYTNKADYFFTSEFQTSTSGPEGSSAHSTDDLFSSIALQHLIYTRSANGNETFYIDGKVAGTTTAPGDFTSWNKNTFKLSLCNSLGFENPWRGKLFLTAIYSDALSAEQVERNFKAGFGNYSSSSGLPGKPEMLASTALSAVAARLTWEELQGDVTGYVIERKERNGRYGYVASVTNNITEFVDASLTAKTSYIYRIGALNNYGQSPYSDESEVKTLSDESLENVALRKRATQSSTTYKGHASRGVDGNTDGVYANKSITHTAYELNAWWEVDLENLCYIDHMEVWNRVDKCCKDRLARFYIFISEKPFESHDFQGTLNQPGVVAIYQEFFPEPVTTLNVAGKGRYIRIQLSDSQNICLAELVVMGSKLENP